MTLIEFVNESGCKIVQCDNKQWGGGYAYTTDNGFCEICGYKTIDAARKGWLTDTFGIKTAKALMKFLT